MKLGKEISFADILAIVFGLVAIAFSINSCSSSANYHRELMISENPKLIYSQGIHSMGTYNDSALGGVHHYIIVEIRISNDGNRGITLTGFKSKLLKPGNKENEWIPAGGQIFWVPDNYSVNSQDKNQITSFVLHENSRIQPPEIEAFIDVGKSYVFRFGMIIERQDFLTRNIRDHLKVEYELQFSNGTSRFFDKECYFQQGTGEEF